MDKLEGMLVADNYSNRLVFESDNDMLLFIKNCEKVYGMTTNQHIDNFVSNKYESNVDKERWYRFGCILKERGYNLQ